MKILICEDEFIIAYTIKSYCEDLGYEVVGLASSKLKAIELLQNNNPDIVLYHL